MFWSMKSLFSLDLYYCMECRLKDENHNPSVAYWFTSLEKGMHRLDHNHVIKDKHINNKLDAPAKELNGKQVSKTSSSYPLATHMENRCFQNVGLREAKIKSLGLGPSIVIVFYDD